jgi:hypothetical protein
MLKVRSQNCSIFATSLSVSTLTGPKLWVHLLGCILIFSPTCFYNFLSGTKLQRKSHKSKKFQKCPGSLINGPKVWGENCVLGNFTILHLNRLWRPRSGAHFSGPSQEETLCFPTKHWQGAGVLKQSTPRCLTLNVVKKVDANGRHWKPKLPSFNLRAPSFGIRAPVSENMVS